MDGVKSVVTVGDMLRVEAVLDPLRCAPLGADHHVVSRLVPEVVTHRCRRSALPASSHCELRAVQQNKTALVDTDNEEARLDAFEMKGGLRATRPTFPKQHLLNDRKSALCDLKNI